MQYSLKIRDRHFTFKDLNEIMAKANEEKSGDILAGIAASSYLERMAAKTLLAGATLDYIRNHPAVPYEKDEVTRVIQDGVDEEAFARIKGWTVAELREALLGDKTDADAIRRISPGLTSEMIAAVAKIMSNMDLILAAKKIRVRAHCNTAVGEEGTLASRLQPNHTTDNIDGIIASIKDGLSYGVGDAVIGINPVDDTLSNIHRVMDSVYEFTHEKVRAPTQICILAHITTQMDAIRKGAKTDLLFQSLAGTEKANQAFGIHTAMLDEGFDLIRKEGKAAGPNCMYFETGQGSELSSDAHEGVDQVTLEARCYGLAKRFAPFLVNTVVGFIGPEYLFDAVQVTRAGLEDHFMGKLTGVSMGVDVCYTNHIRADQNDLENLAVLLTAAGANFFMGIPMGDDVMLNYQTTSFHDIAALREIFRLRPGRAFEEWLTRKGIMENGRLTGKAGDPSIFDE
jgi:ethanolamine ammonia-lyase large subunit